MRIEKGIVITGLGLFLEKQKVLVVSDFHLGYEGMLEKQGVLIPRFQAKDIMKELEKILKKTKPKTVIINGDLKHEFGRILQTEWRYILRLFDLILKYTKKIVIVKGNHDILLQPIAEKRDITIVDSIFVDDIFICHGDYLDDKKVKKAKIIVIGHEHPAISLQEGARVEKYKAFLKGKYKRKTLIVQPSFNPIFQGTDMTREKVLSPFLKGNLGKFEVWIVADKVRYFGMLKDL